MGSSMTSMVQNLSMSLGIAFASMLMATSIGGTHDAASYVSAFRITMVVLGVVTVASSLLFLRLPRPAAS
jgi:hypothetical protein